MAVAPKADLYARAVSDRDEVAAFLRSDRRYAAYRRSVRRKAATSSRSATARA